MTGDRHEGQLRIITVALVERYIVDTCPQRGHCMFTMLIIGVLPSVRRDMMRLSIIIVSLESGDVKR